uniref:Aldehyde dehydrogenase domain-containing protein n=1 Tax=Lactuca sativa TaxID=4236 RepID=A0A9R1XYB1_LACSA|nr:hypothetical protein LSAT_V11C100041480 [Lactuca sativa]
MTKFIDDPQTEERHEGDLKEKYRLAHVMEHKINASQKTQSEIYPLGAVGAIVSWNYPFYNLFNPVLVVVFSGNGIVVKVSEHASWSGCFYVRILQTALVAIGAPENLVKVIIV